MTNEQILEKQVEALEKLLQLKEAVIQELEAKVNRLQYPSYPGVPLYGQGGVGFPGISIPSVWTYHTNCTDGQGHIFGTSNTCTKCGQHSMGGSGGAQGIAGQGAILGGQVGGGFAGGAGGTGIAGSGVTTTTTTAIDGVSQTVTHAQNNVFSLTGTVNK